MKRTFCDKCGDEIKENADWVFGKEICPICSGIISDWLNNKTSILDLAAAAEDDKEDQPVITDPECCGDCYECTHCSQMHCDPAKNEAIIVCRHYKKKLYFEPGDIMVGSPTPLKFKEYGEASFPDCHGYSEEELE